MAQSKLQDLISKYQERADRLEYKSTRDNTIGEATRICLQQNLNVLKGVILDLKLVDALEQSKPVPTKAKAKPKKHTAITAREEDRV